MNSSKYTFGKLGEPIKTKNRNAKMYDMDGNYLGYFESNGVFISERLPLREFKSQPFWRKFI